MVSKVSYRSQALRLPPHAALSRECAQTCSWIQGCSCCSETTGIWPCVNLREPTVDAGPDDGAFLVSLRRSTTNPRGVYPPVAFAEVYCNDSCSLTKVRRLHSKIVDLERAKSVGSDVYWQFQKMNVSARYEECFNTLPVPTSDSDCPLRCIYVYGYEVDGSDGQVTCYGPAEGLMAIFG